MVKIGKKAFTFGKKGRGGAPDDGSVFTSTFSNQGGKKSPQQQGMGSPADMALIVFETPAPVDAAPVAAPVAAALTPAIEAPAVTTAPSPVAPPVAAPAPVPVAAPAAPATAPVPPPASVKSKSSKSTRKLGKKKSGSGSKRNIPSPIEESRDDAPSPTPPSGNADNIPPPPPSPVPEAVESTSSAEAEDEQVYAESATVSEEYADESGTVETYDEELSMPTSGEEDKSTFEEDVTYDDGTQITKEENQTHVSARSANKSLGTHKNTEASKKYFHKDVVLNSLEELNLVIRAMYFIPKPKAEDHVVVKIEASTISARDVVKCKGVGITPAMLPFVPGFEIVGTIQTLGDKAKADRHFHEGDHVAGISTFGGGNSRFISIPASRLTKITNNVKSTEAVCMIHDYMAGLKALRLARKAGSPFTGMNILITDGFSPVGQAVINLASMEGANIYCCADESKHSFLSSLGAKCFSRNPDQWLATATGTFDVVIDNSCIDSYSSSWFALNQKGALVCLAPIYNIDNDDMPANACGVNIVELQQHWAGIKAKYMMTQTSFLNTVTPYDDDTDQYKQDLRYLMFLLERGDIKPKVAERVSLDDVPDAQRLMQTGRANGTVVCVPWIEE